MPDDQADNLGKKLTRSPDLMIIVIADLARNIKNGRGKTSIRLNANEINQLAILPRESVASVRNNSSMCLDIATHRRQTVYRRVTELDRVRGMLSLMRMIDTQREQACERVILAYEAAIERGDDATARTAARRLYALRYCDQAPHIYTVKLTADQEIGFERWLAADYMQTNLRSLGK